MDDGFHDEHDSLEESAPGQKEVSLTCPYCWEPITILVDLSIEAQTFVEDCEVCCNPISLHYRVEEGEIAELEASRAQ